MKRTKRNSEQFGILAEAINDCKEFTSYRLTHLIELLSSQKTLIGCCITELVTKRELDKIRVLVSFCWMALDHTFNKFNYCHPEFNDQDGYLKFLEKASGYLTNYGLVYHTSETSAQWKESIVRLTKKLSSKKCGVDSASFFAAVIKDQVNSLNFS